MFFITRKQCTIYECQKKWQAFTKCYWSMGAMIFYLRVVCDYVHRNSVLVHRDGFMKNIDESQIKWTYLSAENN